MRPAESRWTRTLRQSQHRSGEPRAASFVFCRHPPQPLVETGLLRICSYFVPTRIAAIGSKTLVLAGVHSCR
jgi:hypothetical protein